MSRAAFPAFVEHDGAHLDARGPQEAAELAAALVAVLLQGDATPAACPAHVGCAHFVWPQPRDADIVAEPLSPQPAHRIHHGHDGVLPADRTVASRVNGTQ